MVAAPGHPADLPARPTSTVPTANRVPLAPITYAYHGVTGDDVSTNGL